MDADLAAFLQSSLASSGSRLPNPEDWEFSSEQDRVHFDIYSDITSKAPNNSVALEYLLALRKRLIGRLSEHIIREQQLWHLQSPFVDLKVSIPNIETDEIHLHGSLRFGDNIEDEWYLVHLLMMISSTEDLGVGLSVTIEDCDGQFLLIEAADHLPDWINPECSHNRVWIRHGHVVLLPLSVRSSVSQQPQKQQRVKPSPLFYLDPSRDGDQGIDLDVSTALAALRARPASSAVINETEKVINRSIQARVQGYPGRCLAARHRVATILPRTIASLFHLCPALIALSAYASSTSDISLDMRRRYSSAMARFGNLDSSAASSNTSHGNANGHNSNNSNNINSSNNKTPIVPASLTMTRALYAQLTFKPFHVPKRLQHVTRLVEQLSPQSFDAAWAKVLPNNDAISKAWELGARLICGLELLYQHSKRTRSQASKLIAKQSQGDWTALLQACTARHIDLSSPDKIAALKASFDSQIVTCEPRDSPEEETLLMDVSLRSVEGDQLEAADQLIDRLLGNPAVARAGSPEVIEVDDDRWLYLSADELDKEMEERLARFSGGLDQPQPVASQKQQTDSNVDASQPATSVDQRVEDTADISALSNIFSNFKTFLDGKSGVEGVENHAVEDIFGSEPSTASSSDDSDDELPDRTQRGHLAGARKPQDDRDRDSFEQCRSNSDRGLHSDNDEDSEASESLFGVPSTRKQPNGMVIAGGKPETFDQSLDAVLGGCGTGILRTEASNGSIDELSDEHGDSSDDSDDVSNAAMSNDDTADDDSDGNDNQFMRRYEVTLYYLL